MTQARTKLGTEPLVTDLEKGRKKENNDTVPGLNLIPKAAGEPGINILHKLC